MQIYNLFLNFASYNKKKCWNIYFNTYFINVVQEGIEPPTYWLWVSYSNRWVTGPNWTCTRNCTLTKSLEEICAICYTIQAFVPIIGFEPITLSWWETCSSIWTISVKKRVLFRLFNLPDCPLKDSYYMLFYYFKQIRHSHRQKAKV